MTAVSLAPDRSAISVGESVLVRASARTASGQAAPAEVDWSTDGGTLTSVTDSTALFSAALAGSYKIRGRGRKNQSVQDSTTITVNQPVPPIVAIRVAPKPASLTVGQIQAFTATATRQDGTTLTPNVTWTATGGSITQAGIYTAGSSAGTFRVVATEQGGAHSDTSAVVLSVVAPTLQAIVLSPASASLFTGGTQQFAVSGQWSDGSNTAPAVTYVATGGTVTSGGLFTAGATAGTFRVIATQQGGTLADTAIITLTVPVLQAVVLTPASAALGTGATQQFTVSGQWSNGATTAPAVTFTATGGTITPGGLYTAGAATGTFRVIATQQGGVLADTSAVTLSTSPPVLQAVVLAPSSASVVSGTTRQFTVSGQWSDGSTSAPAVTYSATGGSITSGGLYSAGGTSGTYRVVATQQGGTLADTAMVTVTAPVLQAVVLTPASAALQIGAAQQFTVSGVWNNGATTPPAVSYSATGGTITSGGLYTAGGPAGTFRVVATQQGGTLADTSSVTLTAPVLQAVVIAPASTTVTTGGTQQFSVTGQWSDGATTAPAVTYTATGGTITTAGLYTAGSTTGAYRVIATQQGGGLADTATVTVTAVGSGWLANKPANFTNVRTNYGFDAQIPTATSDQPMGDGSGWNVYYGFWPVHNSARITDASGGVSPTSVVQTDYPAGTRGNTKFYFQPISSSATEFYVALRIKWDSNYEWNDISNKLFYVEPGNIVLQSRHNVGGIQRYLSVYIGANDSDHLPSNNVAITLGQWHTIEYLVRRGTTNGEIHIWLDGVTTLHETGIFVPTTGSSNLLDINDTFGGGGPDRTRTSTRWIDHVYIATP